MKVNTSQIACDMMSTSKRAKARAADEDGEVERQVKHLKSTQDSAQSKVFTCAVSGCSSSGKTTLAALLHEIFAPFHPSSCDQDEIKETLPLVHQDHFFIKNPLYECPITTFTSTAKDVNFMQASIDDENPNPMKRYFYAWTGDRDIDTPISITGPDMDCIESIDFEQMLKIVSSVCASGTTRGLDLPDKEPDYPREALYQSHGELIGTMRRRITQWLGKQKGSAIKWEVSGTNQERIPKFSRKFFFAEGFLILSDPDNDSPPKINMSEPEYLEAALKTAPADLRREIMKSQAEERLRRPARHAARQALMEHFDIKLFLPTEKEVARRRRMDRPVYMDSPVGMRKPGQMWKTQGYFEEIVWGAYVRDFEWMRAGGSVESVDDEEEKLLGTDGTAERKGIRVRPMTDSSIAGTVEWGVDAILSSLEGL